MDTDPKEYKFFPNESFGMTSEKFDIVLREYIESLEKDIPWAEAELADPKPELESTRYYLRLKEGLDRDRSKLEYFKKTEPAAIFDFLQKLFVELKELESRGVESEQILKYSLEKYSEQMLPFLSFIEHYLGVWGYRFAQAVMAYRITYRE